MSFACQSQEISLINIQGVCDAKYKFIDLTVKQPGSVHDSMMFKASGFGRKCALGIYGEGFVLGDSGYGCTPYLLTPYNAPQSPSEVYYIFKLLF